MTLKKSIDNAIILLKNQGECNKECTECPVVYIYTMNRVKECKCPIDRMFLAEHFIKDQVEKLINKNIKSKLGPEYVDFEGE